MVALTTARVVQRHRHLCTGTIPWVRVGVDHATLTGVNRMLKTLAARRGGWFCRADARASGYTESEIRDRLRSGRWRRLCRDGYVEAAAESPTEPVWQRRERLHRLTAAAVAHRMPDAVISHQSAVVMHRLPVWGLALDRMHVTKQGGRWRSTEELVVHRARIEPHHIVRVDGARVTDVPRAAVEAACESSYEAGVVLMDAVLRQRAVTRDELTELVHLLRYRAGAPRAANAVRFADGRSESVGESRLRALMANHGLPAPELQAELFDGRRSLVARVDFLFGPEGLVIEFDGEVKYQSTGDLVAEKWREDRIRELGYAVIRLGWSDLDKPVRTLRRIEQALARRTA